jgi:hypothetical protein
MSDKPHDVVKLLIARMKSHPEEFRVADAPFHDRWYDHVNSIQAFGNEADKAAIAEGLREIRLAETHERVMDELLNGEERRRKVFEEQEYERNLSKSLLLTKHQMVQQAQGSLQNAYASQLGQYNQAQGLGLVGKSPSSIWLDEFANTGIGTQSPSQPLTIGTGGTGALRIKSGGNLTIDGETLDSSTLKKLKKLIGK